jgi:hypothetical protein
VDQGLAVVGGKPPASAYRGRGPALTEYGKWFSKLHKIKLKLELYLSLTSHPRCSFNLSASSPMDYPSISPTEDVVGMPENSAGYSSRAIPMGLYEDGMLDPVYQEKMKILNRAIQEIGTGKYQVRTLLAFHVLNTDTSLCQNLLFLVAGFGWFAYVFSVLSLW